MIKRIKKNTSLLDLDRPIIQWVFLIFLAFIWGSSFILMKRGLEVYEHTQVAALRIIISFVFLSPVIIRNFRMIKSDQWIKIMIAGLLGSGIPAFLFTKAQTHISSALSGMLNSLVPLFTVIIGVAFFQMRLVWMKLIGVVIGLTGAFLLLLASQWDGVSMKEALYGSLVVIATICYATNVNFIKTQLASINSINITAFGFLLIGPLSLIYLLSTDFLDRLGTVPNAYEGLMYIAVLSIFGTAIAVILFNMLIKRVSALFASSVTYIIPVFAILWGLYDGESILGSQLVGIAIILTGVYIVNLENKREKAMQTKKQS